MPFRVLYVCMYVYTYVYMYVCMYVCIYVCMYVRTYVFVYPTHTHTHAHTSCSPPMYVCTYVRVRVYPTLTNTHTHLMFPAKLTKCGRGSLGQEHSLGSETCSKRTIKKRPINVKRNLGALPWFRNLQHRRHAF